MKTISVFLLSVFPFLASCQSEQRQDDNTKGDIVLDSLLTENKDSESLNQDTVKADTTQWEDIYVYNWGQTNDTIIIGSAFLYYPYGSFYDIDSLENSKYFKDKGQYLRKISEGDHSESAYFIGTSKIIFSAFVYKNKDEAWPIEISYLDISNNEMIWFRDIRIGMSICDFNNIVLPNESVRYPISTYILFDVASPFVKEVISFKDDTLSDIKIRTFSTIPSKLYPDGEYLEGEYSPSENLKFKYTNKDPKVYKN